MATIPTVKVLRRGELEPVIVNATDFDATTMEMWNQPPLAPAAPAEKGAAPAPMRPVGRKGSRG